MAICYRGEEEGWEKLQSLDKAHLYSSICTYGTSVISINAARNYCENYGISGDLRVWHVDKDAMFFSL